MYDTLFSKNFIVIYNNSPDGACSAWCWDRYMKHNMIPGTTVKYVRSDQQIPNTRLKTVIMLGFTYNYETMVRIITESQFTLVISNREVDRMLLNLDDLFTVSYKIDLTRSTAQIVWDTVFDSPRPDWVEQNTYLFTIPSQYRF